MVPLGTSVQWLRAGKLRRISHIALIAPPGYLPASMLFLT